MGAPMSHLRARAIAVATILLSAGLTETTASPLKGQLFLAPGVEDYRLLVKFRPDALPSLPASATTQPGSPPTPPASFLPAPPQGGLPHLTRAVVLTLEEQSRLDAPSALRKPAAGAFDILAFAGLYYVDSLRGAKEDLLDYALRLEARDDVEYCVLEPRDPPAPPLDIAPPTPDYAARQTYLGPNPGIDCKHAWSLGIKGKGVQVSDIEFDWNLAHEDLVDQDIEFGLPRRTSQYRNHGTAVLGVLASGHNGYGMDGCAPDAAYRVYPEGAGRATAITRAAADSKPGDIILLEMQVSGPDGKLAPADLNTAVWDAVRKASDAGIIIVAAAGNGGADLGSTSYGPYRTRGDNGSIVVGAGSPNTRHDKLSFSTFGTRVNLQGWGSGVATLDYGNLKPGGTDVNQHYATGFSGTSSASPVVTSAVALVQSYALAKLGRSLTPKEMRDLLTSTGIAQGTGGLIGPLPNIKAAFQKIAPTTISDPPFLSSHPLRILPHQGHLALVTTQVGEALLQVVDIKGQTLIQKTLRMDPTHPASLSTHTLPAGLHHLHWRLGNHRGTLPFVTAGP